MKRLLIFVILCATSAFGQNSYGSDYLNLHCTAVDPSAPPNFGDLPKPGLVPTSAATGNMIVYCDASSGVLKFSVSGSAYAGLGGSGIVSANNGSAGAIAFYASAGGSTTVSQDANLVDTVASSILTYGTASNRGTLALGTDGTVFMQRNGNNTLQITSSNAAVNIAGNGSGNHLQGTGTFIDSSNLSFNASKGQHLNTQAANNDIAGVCSGTTTTCSVTFTTNYTSTPSCVVTPTTAGVTSFIITTQANSGFTVTYAPSATTNFNYICIGNPN